MSNTFKRKKLNTYNKCSICLEDIIVCKFMHFLPCCHFFHKSCVNTWLEKNVTCPECRIPVYIQNVYQYEDYVEFYAKQKLDADLIRRNILTSDNAIALRFVQDTTLFNIYEVEYSDVEKIQSYIHKPELSFDELYGDIFDSDTEYALVYDSEDEYINRDTVAHRRVLFVAEDSDIEESIDMRATDDEVDNKSDDEQVVFVPRTTHYGNITRRTN